MRRERKEQVLCVLAAKIKGILLNEGICFDEMQEIRLREGRPLFVYCGGKERIFSHLVTKEELHETMEYISGYSLYAYENEMRQGFLTIDGGHRVGISGKIIPRGEEVRNFQYISSVNIRVSHEIQGCADHLFPAVLEKGEPCHTLILSPPGCGKTTMLRDLVRQVSDGNAWVEGKNVGVVDERSEIGGCYQGVPQNQLGKRTDILDNCPKAEGMRMMIRSMAPQIVAVDEIGTRKDMEAAARAMYCGITLFATAHGASVEEMEHKPWFAELRRQSPFQRFVVLKAGKKKGVLEGIYNEQGEKIC